MSDQLPTKKLQPVDVARSPTLPAGAAAPTGPTIRDARTVLFPGGVEIQVPDRYELHAILGAGGMGVVCRGHDRTFSRDVAVKVLPPWIVHDPRIRQRVVNEARAAARLRHPNIVEVYDVDADRGYLVMALVDGESLAETLGRGPLPPARVRDIARALLMALEAAHQGGIVHRDMKPGNIMIMPGGGVVVVDFGIAHLADANLTHTGDRLGTPAYMAPEQLAGERLDGRCDVYAVGIVVFEMLVGKRPARFGSLDRDDLDALAAACSDPSLRAVVEGCLRPKVDQRLTAADALAALATPATPATPRRRPRSPFVIPAIAAGTVAAIAAIAFVATRGGDEPAAQVDAATVDDRIDRARQLAHRGEYEPAREILDTHLVEHSRDPRALVLSALVGWWLGSPSTEATMTEALATPLSPSDRVLVRGLQLLLNGRFPESIALIEAADRDHPNQPPILYALGEALWHDAQHERAAVIFARVFDLDPSWQMALEHLIQLRLGGGRHDELERFVQPLATYDPSGAAALSSRILVARRDYARAAEVLRAAIAKDPRSSRLHQRLGEALALAGDHENGKRAAQEAFRLSPVDAREASGFTLWTEFFLYRGDVDGFANAVSGRSMHRVRSLMELLWRGSRHPPVGEAVFTGAVRSPPLWAVTVLVQRESTPEETKARYRGHRDQEIHFFGLGLGAERAGEHTAAVDAYRRALEVPSDGSVRVIIAYHLARTLRAKRDLTGAASACDEVLHPRSYEPHRAVFLPDCLLWTGEAGDVDAARGFYRRLTTAWTGAFDHPAVVAARGHLAK